MENGNEIAKLGKCFLREVWLGFGKKLEPGHSKIGKYKGYGLPRVLIKLLAVFFK